MDIVSLCPLRASGFVWQSQDGRFAQTIVVKATFVLEPGQATLAKEQEAPNEADGHWNDDPSRSVVEPSDKVPYKPRADVMLVGHAYAPGKTPVRSVMTRLTVGEMDKSIEVWCDRVFRAQDGQLLEGPRFAKMPLAWERAAGAPGTMNPVGMRFDAAPDAYGMIPIPNLQPPGILVSKRSDTFASTCFGPVGGKWPGRTQRLGRLAGTFPTPGWEDRPMPDGLDPAYFQAAPADQQVARIQPNERIVLENLHPEHTRLVTALPGLRPRAIADRATGEREEVQFVADTLWIDTDRGLCCVVWRGRIGLRHVAEAGRVAVWVDGMPMVAPEKAQAPGSANPSAVEDDGLAAMTLIGPMVKNAEPALPFVAGTSSLAESNRQIAADISRWAAMIGDGGDGSGTMFAPLSAPANPVMPFGPQEDEPEDLAETIPPLPKAGTGATPFMPVVPPLQPLRLEEASSSEVPAIGYLEPAAVARSSEGMAPTVEKARVEVAPPPMIGPIAGVKIAADKPAEVAAKGPTNGNDGAGAAAKPAEEEKVAELSIEETATIAAELAEGKTERAAILEAHGVREAAWKANETRWNKALEGEQSRGKSALRAAHDAAYVTRVEKFRGPITVDEYARIMVGLERGGANAVLGALKIQQPALMPIVRVWVKKVAKDMKLGEEARKAVREAKRV